MKNNTDGDRMVWRFAAFYLIDDFKDFLGLVEFYRFLDGFYTWLLIWVWWCGFCFQFSLFSSEFVSSCFLIKFSLKIFEMENESKINKSFKSDPTYYDDGVLFTSPYYILLCLKVPLSKCWQLKQKRLLLGRNVQKTWVLWPFDKMKRDWSKRDILSYFGTSHFILFEINYKYKKWRTIVVLFSHFSQSPWNRHLGYSWVIHFFVRIIFTMITSFFLGENEGIFLKAHLTIISFSVFVSSGGFILDTYRGFFLFVYNVFFLCSYPSTVYVFIICVTRQIIISIIRVLAKAGCWTIGRILWKTWTI